MTIANFKQQVANYMNRSLASLTSDNSQDMLLSAMNDARRAAQRDHEFELLRTEDAYLSTSQAGANWQTGCKTTPGGATAVLMRRIDEVWNYSTSTDPSTNYLRTTRIPMDYSGQFKRELPVVNRTTIATGTGQNYTTQVQFAYAVGPTLYLTTSGTATIVKLVGIKFLDDIAGETEDFFLSYFTDWFRYATIAALNIYLKDTERFPIDSTTMSRLWQSVKNFDGGISNMGEAINLD